ncbi:MAG: O-acetylhomoserine aminocarboxypropyltransferase/cysteine synthase [Methanomassiliicoccaceae archaeon]|nr:O-acetylhomoserine aminocarboxypropyltransferase/cysteine synthase [Methanomassiliicoccaceae archaeon]
MSRSKKDNVPSGPNNDKKLRFETLQLHKGQEVPDPVSGARAVPIYLTAAYVFKDCKAASERFALTDPGNIYGRLTNNTQAILEDRIAALEGGSAALATASGAAAIMYTLQNITSAGDHIVAANNLYGGTYNYLEHTFSRFGVKTTFVDPGDLNNFEKAMQKNTKAVYIETLGNPNSDFIDVEKVAEIAHKHGIILIVDNTFATPFLYRPLEHGADIVVESATKFIGGHGTVLGGLIIEGGKFDWAASGKYPQLVEPDASYHGISFFKAAGPAAFVTRIRAVLLRDTGAVISPITAFILLQGLETLSLRVERHVQNALEVVRYLSGHPKVLKVNHPSLEDHPCHDLYEKNFPDGAGSIFTFDIKGGEKEAIRFIDSLKLFSLLANVADMKSLVIHPATTIHSQLNDRELKEQKINRGTVRLSIGTENIKDIIADLEQAFDKV